MFLLAQKGIGARVLMLAVTVFVAATCGDCSAAESADSISRDFRSFRHDDWPMIGGDWFNTRYASLDQINTHTVKRLRGAWVSQLFDEGGTSRVTPVVVDGVLFVTAGRAVYALNAQTGERIWKYKFGTSRSEMSAVALAMGLVPGALPNFKGVAVGPDQVFVGLMDGRVVALKKVSGEPVWVRQIGDDEPRKGQWVGTAPTYANGVVFAGLANGDANLIGRTVALDARTGEVLWTRFSIPAPTEYGHETWPSSNDVWKIGGGGVWSHLPVDTELGLVYATTGNPVPAFAGDWRAGDNLFTSSVLAIDMRTGELRWHYQLVHHDVFDADAGTPVILFDTATPHGNRKALAVVRADGNLFQLDRRTGVPIFPIREMPVPQLESQQTSPTQPFPVGVESFLMSCDDWRKELLPAGFSLGCMWTPPAAPPPSSDAQNVLAPFPSVRMAPIAYSPQTGYFYAQGTSMLSWPRRATDPYFHYTGFVDAVPGLKSHAVLAAIDHRTGKIAWKTPILSGARNGLPVQMNGGLIVTAGNLVFRGAGDGNLEAYDARSGQLVWRFQTGIAGTAGAPSSYRIGGEQYVAVPMGRALWAFKLDGHVLPSETSTVEAGEGGAVDRVTDTEAIETVSLKRSLQGSGMRYFADEYGFNPYRARVRAGTRLLFVNNGNIAHRFVAVDGSWGTGVLSPSQQAWIRFDTPGEYPYICSVHPWSYGEVIVVPEEVSGMARPGSADATVPLPSIDNAERVRRGKAQFDQYCSMCHGENLGGRASAPPLAGAMFMAHWKSSTTADLLARIQTTMPQSNPGSLGGQAYQDILAYLLRENGLLPETEKGGVARSLKDLRISH